MPCGSSGRTPGFPGCRVPPGYTPDGSGWARQAGLPADKKQSKLVGGARSRHGAFTPKGEYSQYRLYSIDRKVPGHVKGSAPDPR